MFDWVLKAFLIIHIESPKNLFNVISILPKYLEQNFSL